MTDWIHQHFWLGWCILFVLIVALLQFINDMRKEYKKQKEHQDKINRIDL